MTLIVTMMQFRCAEAQGQPAGAEPDCPPLEAWPLPDLRLFQAGLLHDPRDRTFAPSIIIRLPGSAPVPEMVPFQTATEHRKLGQ